ncbi:sensor histidine kinase [Actinoplanes sp. NPDC051343]|uniref:sensor histidine kinase n=1 Tax=Actinoplanes sp. NPDC051343 TaxID=3363906 RepID=UPI00379ED6A8
MYADTSAAGPVTGNRVLLARMVSNVIDNAVVHNVPGGWIRVAVTGRSMVVANSGPVLDPASLPRLGRPFERLAPDRTAASACRSCTPSRPPSGTVSLSAVPDGGLQVEITLP